MRILRTSVPLAAVMCVTLIVSACSVTGDTGGSTGGGSTGGGTPTVGATATPKAKPTGVPTLTVAYCTQLMTVAEANTFMNPPTLATNIRVDNGQSGGSCNYEYAQFKSVVTITLVSYQGPQDPQSEQNAINAAASQLASAKGAAVTTTAVSGVGDIAMFVTVTVASPPLKEAALDALYGALFVSCANFTVGSSSFATQQTALTQVCTQVISRL
jgi:hypothetical protein